MGKRYREGRLSYAGGHIQTNMLPSPEQLQPRSQSTFKFECKGPRAHEASAGGLLAKSRFALRNVVPSFVLDFWIGRRCQAVRQLTNSPVESSAISSPQRLQLNRRVIVAGFRQGHRQSYPRKIPCGQVTIFRSGVRVGQGYVPSLDCLAQQNTHGYTVERPHLTQQF